MAVSRNAYEQEHDGVLQRWDPSVGRWRDVAAAAPKREVEVTPIVDLSLAPANPQRGTMLEVIGASPIQGVWVTHDQAFMTAAVWACIDVIASAIGASDWNVYAGVRGSAEGKKAIPDAQAQFLLNSRPNPEMTALSGKRALVAAAVGYGNGYAEIGFDLAGRFASLWPISPDRVQVRRNERRELIYRVTQDSLGGTIDLDPADVFHIRGASLVGTRGDDAVARAIRTISMNIALDEFAASYYGNGTHLGGIITTKGKLDEPEFEELKRRWSERHQGPRKSFRTGILEGDATYTPIDSNAQKADLTNWKYAIVEEVCRWFRVPPHKIAHLLRATNNNIEHQGLEFTRDTLRPWAKEIEQETDYKLLGGAGPKRFCELDLDWASQGDYQSRATAFQTLLNTGVFSVNDVLRKLGENTIGKAGDIRLVQGAMIPLERAGESYRATGTPLKPESPSDPGTPGESTPAKPPKGPKNVLQAWLGSVFARAQRRHAAGQKTPEDTEQHLRNLLADMQRELFDLSEERDPVGIALSIGMECAVDQGHPAQAAARCIELLKGTA